MHVRNDADGFVAEPLGASVAGPCTDELFWPDWVDEPEDCPGVKGWLTGAGCCCCGGFCDETRKKSL